MANSSFGDAFSRSFDSVVASLRRERESELADRRLRERMKEEKEATLGETLLKELGATGADVSSFRRNDGGIYREAAEMELAEAQRQAIAGRAAAYSSTGGGIGVLAGPSEGAGASEGAYHKAFAAGQSERGVEAARDIAHNKRLQKAQQEERDRVEGDATDLAAKNAPEGVAFDFRGDWRQQIEDEKAFEIHRMQQGELGMPLSERASANTGYPEMTESFEPAKVTPGMIGQMARFKESKGIRLGEEAINRTQAQLDKQIGIRAEADYNALSFSQKEVFRRQLGADSGKPFNFSDNPHGGAAKVISARLEEGRQYEKKSDEAKRDIDYINKNAIYIPIGSSYKPDYDADGNPTQVSMAEFRMRNKEVIDPVSRLISRQWFSGSLDPLPMPGVPGVAAPGAASPAAIAPGGDVVWDDVNPGEDYDFGGVTATPTPAPTGTVQGGSSTESLWLKRGVSKATYDVADEVFSSLDQSGTKEIQVKDARGKLNPKKATWDIDDVNFRDESLFGAAMLRLDNENARLSKRLNDSFSKAQKLKKEIAGPSTRGDAQARSKLSNLLRQDIDDLKERERVNELVQRLNKSRTSQ